MSRCPRGCVCQAERAPGSNITEAPETRDAGAASKSGVTCTVPVNHAPGPGSAGRSTRREIRIVRVSTARCACAATLAGLRSETVSVRANTAPHLAATDAPSVCGTVASRSLICTRAICRGARVSEAIAYRAPMSIT